MTINDPRPVREEYVVHTTEVRESSAGWWIGAIVAILAIVAVVFLVTRSSPTQQDLNNANEQGRLTGALETSQSDLSQVGSATQSAADSAAQRASEAADRAESAASTVTAKIDQKSNNPAPPSPQPVNP